MPFYDNKADLELKNFVAYARQLGTGPNIRARNAAVMRLAEYSNLKDTKEILGKLYEWEN